MLVVEGLRKRYGRVVAVDGVSFSVPQGKIVGFIGPNGAGKTTTIKSILGLVRPNEGRVSVNGVDAWRVPSVKRLLGYVPELPEAPGWMTACGLLEKLGVLDGLGFNEARRVAKSVLNELGLGDKCDIAISRLSKGERKRVLIAQAMLVEHEYYLLDEPLTGLDPEWIARVRRLIVEFREQGAGVLVSSHLLRELEEIVDRVVIISRGRVVFEGTLDQLAERAGARGGVVVIKCSEPVKVANALRSSRLVLEVSLYGGGVRAVIPESHDPMEVVDYVRRLGVEVKGFEVSRVSLEDAYLKLVGVKGDGR